MIADDFIECVSIGIVPGDVIALLEGYSVTDNYYDAVDHFPIKVVIRRYREYGQKMYDRSMPVMYKPDEIWKYREYDWTRESARGGFAKVNGKSVQLSGPLKWDALVVDMKSRGWDKSDPLVMGISDKRAMVREGNHRLAIAREAGINVPVDFVFGAHLGLPSRSKKRQDDEAEMTRRLNAASVKQAIKHPSKPLDKETLKTVDDIMDLLGM